MEHAKYMLPRKCDNVTFATLSAFRVAYSGTRTRMVHRNANDGVARTQNAKYLLQRTCGNAKFNIAGSACEGVRHAHEAICSTAAPAWFSMRCFGRGA